MRNRIDKLKMMVSNAPLLCLLLAFFMTCTTAFADDLPPCESGFRSYPNLANISDDLRDLFHPVMKFPSQTKIPVLDCTQATGLASDAQIQRAKIRNGLFGFVWKNFVVHRIAESKWMQKLFPSQSSKWGFGKYDEDRRLM